MLNTNLNRKYYKSDDIEHGRVVVSFFEKFTTEVFNKVNKFYVAHEEWTGESFLPLLKNERMSYSLMAAAIDELTPVHLSEVSFNLSESSNLNESRRVDLWCLYKSTNYGKSINFL